MSEFQFIIRFLRYKIFSHSKKGHGVHSPFVFEFIEEVLSPGKNESENKERSLLKWHRDLKSDKTEMQISEMGAGSRKKTGTIVSVGALIKKTGIRPKFGRLLARLVAYYNPEKIIELGTGLGLSTVYLAGSLPDAEVHTVEGDNARLSYAKQQFRKLGLNNILSYNESFENFLLSASFKVGKYAVFLDGNHKLEPSLKYFNYFADICNEDSLIVLDDINWSDEMREAWRTVKTHPSVSISIDLFFVGIVFFKKGIPKQNYVLNF